jgi:hypothetical protein
MAGKLRSRIVVEGMNRAPHRAFLHAMGLTNEDLQRPFIGIASPQSEVTPCNIHLDGFAADIATGISEAGGLPRLFHTAAVADSMSMAHQGMRMSLISRELIADSVEAVVRGHAYDAVVTLAGCDKTLPGMMMGMVRLNLPAGFLFGGSALPGRLNGKDVTILDVYEGVGAVLPSHLRASPLLPSVSRSRAQRAAHTNPSPRLTAQTASTHASWGKGRRERVCVVFFVGGWRARWGAAWLESGRRACSERPWAGSAARCGGQSGGGGGVHRKKKKLGAPITFRPMRITARLPPCFARPLTRRPASSSAMGAPAASPLADANVAVVAGLSPQPLWRFFGELSALPRPSKQEER